MQDLALGMNITSTREIVFSNQQNSSEASTIYYEMGLLKFWKGCEEHTINRVLVGWKIESASLKEITIDAWGKLWNKTNNLVEWRKPYILVQTCFSIIFYDQSARSQGIRTIQFILQ